MPAGIRPRRRAQRSRPGITPLARLLVSWAGAPLSPISPTYQQDRGGEMVSFCYFFFIVWLGKGQAIGLLLFRDAPFTLRPLGSTHSGRLGASLLTYNRKTLYSLIKQTTNRFRTCYLATRLGQRLFSKNSMALAGKQSIK